jgi:uncharacterized RDD family membrane protein YckC
VRRLAPVLAALLAAGCSGWVRPLPAADGERLFLLLAGKRLNAQDPETLFRLSYTRAAAGGWADLGARTGAARSAALWRGELWVLYRDGISAYRVQQGELVRGRLEGFPGGGLPSELVVQGGALWALRPGDGWMELFRRTDPAQGWEAMPGRLELGAVAGPVTAAGADDALWVLWRKRGEGGGVGPETFSAFYADGVWRRGEARVLGGREMAACADPRGGGLLVAAIRRVEAGVYGGRQVTLSRLSASGWEEPRAIPVEPPRFGSAMLGLGLVAVPAESGSGGEAEVLVLVGRFEGAAVYRCAVAADGSLPLDWEPSGLVELDMHGPEIPLAVMLLMAALAVGAGLGVAAVRRTRVFPLLPGQPAPAPLPSRVAAWALDNLLVGLVFCGVLVLTGRPLGQVLRHGALLPLLVGAYRLVCYFYAAIFEARWGTTPGKLAFGLRVATLDGRRPTARSAAIRNVFRLLDEALVFPLPGLIMTILSRHAQRLGDVFAGTLVSTARSVQEVAEDRRRKSDRFGLP